MSLTTYQKKRNFEQSPEPEGKSKKVPELAFVIQRHKASHLHYDFRIEVNGVLKSWAIPKGPSMNPGDKRLAMMVEDHPYEYKDFKGIIPEGNYGAGIVEIWDHGTYSDLEHNSKEKVEMNMMEGIFKGSLKFRLYGKKLNGEFALVKIKQGNAKDNSWLLIKHNDEYAVSEPYNSEDLTPSGSPINKWLLEKDSGSHKKKIPHR